MSNSAFIAAVLAATAAAVASPAGAGERHHHRHPVVIHVHETHGAPWYRQPPWIGTGVAQYYSYHPNHLPGYPHDLTGYPIPIHRLDAGDPVVRAFRAAPSMHVDWCLARYRSYDPRSDTFQPYHGPRRVCLSPYR